jgi:hypothetical protein
MTLISIDSRVGRLQVPIKMARQQTTGEPLVNAQSHCPEQLSITGNGHTNGLSSTIANEMNGHLASSGLRTMPGPQREPGK